MKRERVKLRILGIKIKELRKINGLTQTDLATAVDVSLDTVKNWEQGYNYPTIDKLQDLADFFNCDYDFLFGKQTKPIKQLSDISHCTGISYNSVQQLIYNHNNNNPIVPLISELIANETLLQELSICCDSDYGHISTFESVTYDPFTKKKCSVLVDPESLRKIDLLNLFTALTDFIDQHPSRQEADEK